jgi:AcrR family transcriptional regulator
MRRPVKTSRPYDSSRRQEHARENRLAILHAARRLFLANGYAATTMATVAGEAGVSVETVYKAFANKPGLVKAVFDVAVVGDDEPVPMVEREFVQRTTAQPDPRRKLLGYGAHVAEVNGRSGPVQLVVREAAAVDPGAADVWSQLQAERFTGMTLFATHLGEGGHLREDVSVDEARDVLWALNSVELWDLLVNHRGWADNRYGAWVGQQLVTALLPGSSAVHR